MESERKKIENEKEAEEKMLESIAPVKCAIPNVFKLYCAIETFGSSRAIMNQHFLL